MTQHGPIPGTRARVVHRWRRQWPPRCAALNLLIKLGDARSRSGSQRAAERQRPLPSRDRPSFAAVATAGMCQLQTFKLVVPTKSLFPGIVSRIDEVYAPRASKLYLDNCLFVCCPNIVGVFCWERENRTRFQHFTFRRIKLFAHSISKVAADNGHYLSIRMSVRGHLDSLAEILTAGQSVPTCLGRRLKRRLARL
jgi:hypothetical protein